MTENFYSLNTEWNDGVLLEEYQGKWSLVMAQDKDGTVYKRWVYPQKRVDKENVPGDKAIPHKILLGNKDQAVQILSHFLDVLQPGGMRSDTPNPPPFDDDDSIPF